MGVNHTPKLGVFSTFSKYSFLCCFITQFMKKLYQWSLYEVIEDILPFVLNTKRPLSYIWLLRYNQNSFGCFRKNSECNFFKKTPKTVLLNHTGAQGSIITGNMRTRFPRNVRAQAKFLIGFTQVDRASLTKEISFLTRIYFL